MLLLAGSLLATANAKTYKVYFLGGQSNMVGFGHENELPGDLDRRIYEVPIFSGSSKMDENLAGGDGKWTTLGIGFGLGSDFVDGQYVLSDRFGPEITFADELLKIAPEENIAIIKYAWGGTALLDGVSGYGSWDPKVRKLNQYDYFLKTVRKALAARDIDNDGEHDLLVPAGIIWMQGEADAFESQAASQAYQENLANLMSLMRAAFHDNSLPIVIGRITDSRSGQSKPVMKYSHTVRQAQKAFAAQDPFASLSTVTEQLEYGEHDAWHYLSEGYLLMGRDFAQEIHSLNQTKPTD
ncbi:conserved domain protein [Verrucomicrobiia bacterium DG1235]|nr:conserved domain protein [Verrucomicrobiae bacterium DG1235]